MVSMASSKSINVPTVTSLLSMKSAILLIITRTAKAESDYFESHAGVYTGWQSFAKIL